MQDDLDAIRKGTLTGTAAVSQVQTDAAAVLTSMGLTSAQVSQIQTDQQALATAIAADPNQPAMTSGSSASLDTLQSVSAYLVGLPGVSSFGMGGVSIRGFGPGSAAAARRIHGLALVQTEWARGIAAVATPSPFLESQPLYELATMDSTDTQGISCITDDRRHEWRSSTGHARAGALRALDRRRRRALRADARVLCCARDPDRGDPRWPPRAGTSLLPAPTI